MSDLLSLLSLGSSALQAQNTGVGVATNNVANANTDGYSRQRVDLESLLAAPLVGGVRSGTPDRLQDNLLNGRIRNAAGSLAMSRAFASALTEVEDAVSGNGDTISQDMGEMFSRLGQVAASPTDPSQREAAVSAIRDLVAGIRRRAAALDEQMAASNQRIADNAKQASEIAARLGKTNTDIQKTNDPALRDERDRLAAQLSGLVGGTGRIDGDGQMRWTLDDGSVLVDGAHAAKVETSPDPTTGNLNVAIVDGSSRRDVTKTLGSGAVGADLSVRDKTIAGAKTKLDQLAYDTANQFNTAHRAGQGLDGVSGRDMFVAPGAVKDAAKNLEIDPGLDADPSQLATGAVGKGPGDNANALALYNLKDSGLTDRALDIVSGVATQAADANASVTRDGLVSDHLAGLRDSLAGVDTQEELTNLSKFEHASSALTKFVSTIDSMLSDLIDKI